MKDIKARRLLIFPTPRPASLTPVYLAFAAVALAALLAFVLAMWPRRDGPPEYRPVQAETPVRSRT